MAAKKDSPQKEEGEFKTPEREVTASVVNQLADIERSAYATVQSVVLIASIFFVFLFLCACWTAR